MHVKNTKALIRGSVARKNALLILEAGLQAIDPMVAVQEKVVIKNNVLLCGNARIDLRKFKRIFFVGIGKAALSTARGVEVTLGDLLTDGIALDIRTGPLKHIRSIAGTHPFPSEKNIRATQEIKAMISGLKKDDLVITAITGGGSALLCSAPEMTCEEEIDVVHRCFAAGATIEELNTLRKHISDIRGGGLARIAYPATILSLIISDTPGCSMDMVASGPTLYDPTTVKDARAIQKKYALPQFSLFETPKEKKYFSRVYNTLLLCNMDALNAMHHQALSLGYKAKVLGSALSGEARTVVHRYAQDIGVREVLIGGGETTVTIRGKGTGGRNQEVVLGALPFLDKGMVVASINSDGLDNTDAAGAIADHETRIRAKKIVCAPREYLTRNDSYHFFEKLDDLIRTGHTGTNVSDLFVLLRE
ncbi:MAG: DUF4147 domain-containing protein [Candidatus Uhrbacteria bacterium]|nr:DUF4147 domain-containing protein [Candidatus Uhrbacteria bacterium]